MRIPGSRLNSSVSSFSLFLFVLFVCLFVLSKRGGVYGNIEVGILSVQVGNENL